MPINQLYIFGEISVQVLCSSFNLVDCIFVIELEVFSMYYVYKFFVRYMICKYFLPFCFLFIFLMCPWKQKFLICIKFNFYLLFLLSFVILGRTPTAAHVIV